MLNIALTGGIATGKSYVVAELQRRGVPCVDADELAHGVMTPGSEAMRAIAARFGAGVIGADGAVDRKALGTMVFADSDARRELEAIVHPAVYRAIGAALRAFQTLGGADAAVAAIPLLFETGRASEFDRVVATVCSVDAQRARLAARGLTPIEVDQRLAAQMPAAEKAARADDVIDTNGSFAQTAQQIDELLRTWRELGSR